MPLPEDIVRCDEIARANGNPHHPCRKILSVQRDIAGSQNYQVPEPWRGDIHHAPLLFISSNPSIDLLDDAPWSHVPTGVICNYYQQPQISAVFPRAQYRYGVASRRPVSFWASVHQRAIELYGNNVNVRHGIDYAITEVVHCKSKEEFGVAEARELCSSKFLPDVLEYSLCVFIVSLGAHAEAAIGALNPADGRERLWLAHPGSFGIVQRAKTVRGAIEMGHFTDAQLQQVSNVLNVARAALPA